MRTELNHFLTFLSEEKHYSMHTIDNYNRDIMHFIASQHKSDTKLEFLEHSHCRKYLQELSQEGYTVKTILRKIAALRSFWRYLISQKKAANNPFA